MYITTYTIAIATQQAIQELLLVFQFCRNVLYLGAYISCTVHEQESVVVRHKRTNYMCSIAGGYTALNVIGVYIADVQLASILLNFLSNSTSTLVQLY